MKKYKLGEIADYVGSGMTPLRSNELYWKSNDIPWLKTEQLGVYKIFDTKEYISNLALKECNLKVYPKNTLSIAMYGEGKTRGNVSILAKEMTTNQACCNLIVNKTIADYKFVFYYLKNSYNVLCSLSSGIRKNLNSEDIKNFEISLPPFESQQKIAAVLSTLDDKIALNRRMNAKLEQMAKQLYDHWFVQFDFPNADGKPYKASGGKMEYNEVLKREIPDGWEVGILSDIANITMGQSLEGSSYNEDGKGTIFYQGSTDFGIRFPTVRMYTTEPTRFAKKGDILMSVRAPVGAVNIANADCCIGRGLATLNSKIGSITHLWYLMDVFKHTFENKNAAGTTFGSITKDELFNLPVVIHSNDVILAFNKKTLSIFNYQLSIEKETQKLTALRDRLLPLLMNGQVEVK